jgi:hypothetical protein
MCHQGSSRCEKIAGRQTAEKLRKGLNMRKLLMLTTVVALGFGLLSLGLAQEVKPTKSPDVKKVETKADIAAVAGLRAELHRTIADLIEARVAEKPDNAKIESLTKKVQTLREKLQSQSPACCAQCRGCPCAGECLGCGCCGCGMRAARGCWQGMGGGPGCGMGRGNGCGMGRGYGCGMGRGVGPAFVDENNNGICDRAEAKCGNRP